MGYPVHVSIALPQAGAVRPVPVWPGRVRPELDGRRTERTGRGWPDIMTPSIMCSAMPCGVRWSVLSSGPAGHSTTSGQRSAASGQRMASLAGPTFGLMVQSGERRIPSSMASREKREKKNDKEHTEKEERDRLGERWTPAELMIGRECAEKGAFIEPF